MEKKGIKSFQMAVERTTVQVLTLGAYQVQISYEFGIYDSGRDIILPPNYNPIATALQDGERTEVDDFTPKKHNIRIEIVPKTIIKKY